MSLAPFTVPVVVGSTGRINTPPSTLNATLISYVSSEQPGYTANLPGSLIEDISSTCTGALVLCDQLVTDLINSVGPLSANPFILYQLGQVYGVAPGSTTNTSVFVVFSGTPGYIIPIGFTVGDGTFQYTVQDGGVIGQGGTSVALYCLATQTGTWAVPAGSVTEVITTVPSPYVVTCTNPSAGLPSSGDQTEEEYRAQVYLAGISPASAFASTAKSLINQVPGVQPQLVSFQQQSPGWKAIVGGGDPYAVANAIFNSGIDISALVGSFMTVANITNANPATVTTVLNHGLSTGDKTNINGATGMSGVNTQWTVTVLDEKTFTIPVNTTSSGTYNADSAFLTPNTRNMVVNLINYPDVYSIPIVIPPQQIVVIALTWNTNSVNSVSASAVAQYAAPAIQSYINSIPVGQPINLFELDLVFQQAVASLLPSANLTRMVWAVNINGVLTAPSAGTGIISGDPESYFFCADTGVTVTQG